jgi:hypothetical protein
MPGRFAPTRKAIGAAFLEWRMQYLPFRDWYIFGDEILVGWVVPRGPDWVLKALSRWAIRVKRPGELPSNLTPDEIRAFDAAERHQQWVMDLREAGFVLVRRNEVDA